jgi:hypothetical protein
VVGEGRLEEGLGVVRVEEGASLVVSLDKEEGEGEAVEVVEVVEVVEEGVRDE